MWFLQLLTKTINKYAHKLFIINNTVRNNKLLSNSKKLMVISKVNPFLAQFNIL